MKEYTWIDRLLDIVRTPYKNIRYYFAKKWLDENFGEQEYWGEYISDLISNGAEKCRTGEVSNPPEITLTSSK